MQTVQTEATWGFSADAASGDYQNAHRLSAKSQGQQVDDRQGLPSGWWLLPSVALGASFWVWTISALVS